MFVFSASDSLVNIPCIFSVLFLRSWVIFTVTLNSFSERLPVSASFSCFSRGFILSLHLEHNSLFHPDFLSCDFCSRCCGIVVLLLLIVLYICSLEKEMATHSRILAWRSPWTEEPVQATVHGIAKSQTQLVSTFPFWWMRLRGFCKLPSVVASLSLDTGCVFWWVPVFACPSCSTASGDCGAFAGGGECTSSYSTILMKFEVTIVSVKFNQAVFLLWLIRVCHV